LSKFKDIATNIAVTVTAGVILIFVREWVLGLNNSSDGREGEENRSRLTTSYESKSQEGLKKQGISTYHNSNYTMAKLKNFVNDYYKISSTSKIKAYLEFFSFPLERYYDKESITRRELKSIRKNYIKKWTIREYEVQDIEIREKKPDRAVVVTTYDWFIKNSHTGKTLNGTKNVVLKMSYKDGKFQIYSLEEL
jgi:hypothetical protein